MMELLLLVLVTVAVAALVLAPDVRGMIGRRMDTLRGQSRRWLGRWTARDMQRAAIREIARRAMISVHAAYLWDKITLALSPEDFGRVEPFLPEFAGDIERLVNEMAQRPPARANVSRYRLVAAPQVSVVMDASVLPGQQRVTGHVTGSAPRGVQRSTGAGALPATTALATRRMGDRGPQALLNLDGKTYVIFDEMSVGRSGHCDIVLSDQRISKRHATLHRDKDRVTVEDAGSLNGTNVNGNRATGRVELKSGDLVSFGGTPAGRFVIDVETSKLESIA